MKPSKEDRCCHVVRMRANFAIEGMQPDEVDIALQNAYIAGEMTLNEMLAYAWSFALSCSLSDAK